MLKITEILKPLVLCILDGWGIGENYSGNAIARANPLNFNSFWTTFPHTFLTTNGKSVGLPENEVGNSEVGHENLGAGKIVTQALLRINFAIEDGQFFQNQAIQDSIEHAKQYQSKIHLIGLVGNGSVHSDMNHLYALLGFFKRENFPHSMVKLHVITDGRDSSPISAKDFILELNTILNTQNLGEIATICGRYFAMDRDNRWERTQKAYQAMTGRGKLKSPDATRVIEDSYSQGVTDEFIEPTIIVNHTGVPTGPISQDDSAIFFNFRPDRARQLTKSFVLPDFKNVLTSSRQLVETFDRGPKIKNLFFTTLTRYEKDLPVSAIAFEDEKVEMPIARVFSQRNDRQFHIAETEKYAHVTYFFNGGQESPFRGEDRWLVNSPKVACYDQKPEMSAREIANKLISVVNTNNYDFCVCNFANADMIAHTGNFEAAIVAVKFLDVMIGSVVRATLAKGGAVIITADHGNAEVMINRQTNQIDTEHNPSPAPCIIIARELQGKDTQLPMGILADVAPTILAMLNIPKPSQMTGRNLLA